ncbi:MAG: hypothetical protein F4148_15295 [Caldilineaceae bacterium SB0675_bin_29]|uniref:Uncharacterized protein n=1 Tax=Caldilineaceae bacterium SB0675_bin_29 TaxID=2605266 RepID=A0A6B1G796_9CHLR|nr:hypothetical protein [Candidatus Poribacteria bacterium]MYH63055.1 hypothetical protein [Caldilineaceae bacterium SB0675_bin_29]
MVEWRVIGAVVVALAGFYAGFYTSSSIYGSCYTNVTRTVFVPWGVFLALVLATSAWKLRKEIFGYVILLATAGISGAILSLALIAFILD